MKKYVDVIIPYVGIEINISPILHFFRDLLFTFIFLKIGFQDFNAALTTMLVSGFWEAGNGICFNSDGTHSHFDFLDLLPSVFAGFLMVGFLSKSYDFTILFKLISIYLVVVLLFLFLNTLLGRKIIIK